MSDKQVREAAIDTLECLGSDRLGELLFSNVRKVCESWLAEHPEDGETPVMMEWLLSVGFEWNENETSDYLLINNTKSVNKFGLVYLPTSCVWLLSDEVNELTLDIRTRGDVRRLARALRVNLKEVV